MKIALGLLFACASAQAAPSEMALSSAVEELNRSSVCLNVLENSLATVAHFSVKARKNILSNLNHYQNLVIEARNNIVLKQSNQKIYAIINQTLDRHSKDTVAGLPIGAEVVKCVRSELTFTGTPAQQYALATQALSKIESIRKAVQ